MFVLCPHCQFLVTLDPTNGQPPLRCPHCEALLQEQAAESTTAPGQENGTGDVTDDVTGDVAKTEQPAAAQAALEAKPEPTDVDALQSQDAAGPDPALADPDPESTSDALMDSETAPRQGVRKPAPSFVRGPAPETTSTMHGRWKMSAGIVGLALLLLMQTLLADRAQLAADARWRPTLSALCGMLQCSLPPWHESAAFTLLDRDVRPDPTNPGALQVTASFRNDAQWPQPWPSLLLTLSDVDGRVAGTRLFAPHEYLADNVSQNGLASGQSASIAMKVMEPSPRIVAFTFDFR